MRRPAEATEEDWARRHTKRLNAQSFIRRSRNFRQLTLGGVSIFVLGQQESFWRGVGVEIQMFGPHKHYV